MNKRRENASKPSQEKITRLVVNEPIELLTFLLNQLANRGRNSVKAVLARDQVSVNNKVVTKYNYALTPGQEVTIRWGIAPEEFHMAGVKIIHEDDDLLVIQKESGLLSIASDKETELTAYRQLTEYIRRTNPKNRVFVVHRLDRDTSGIMMFAKNEKSQQELQNTWQESVLERTYIALVQGNVKKPEGTITSWLKEGKTLLMYSSPTANGGDKAVTHYKVIQANRDFSLLEVNLETGRKNQIRVHMQDIGHPVVGDKKYGSTKNTIGRLGLHARVLAFQHPTTGEALRFETKIPEKFLNPFKQ